MAFLNINDKNTFGEISKKDDRKIMSNLKIGGSYLEDQIVTNVKGIIFVVFYLIIETNVVVRIEITSILNIFALQIVHQLIALIL